MTQLLLRLCDVSKSFQQKQLFRGLSFDFANGIYAIVGANGIGKSTLLNMISGSVPVDDGRIEVNGVDLYRDPVAAKMQMSFIPDKAMIYPFITGAEFIKFIAAIKRQADMSEAMAIATTFQLNNYLNSRFSEMSLGTQKKFMIVAAMMGNPSVIIMDEPTNALDEASREELINYMQNQAKQKIFITATHDQQSLVSLAARKIVLTSTPITSLTEAKDEDSDYSVGKRKHLPNPAFETKAVNEPSL